MHTGIDLGLKTTAIVTIDDKGVKIHSHSFGSNVNGSHQKLVKAHPAKRYREYYNSFCTYFEMYKITGTVIMEKPMGRVIGNARKVLEMYGFYLVALTKFFPYGRIYVPTPTEIKKSFTGDGSAVKLDMINECKDRGYFPNSDHEADAIAMALMGHNGHFD